MIYPVYLIKQNSTNRIADGSHPVAKIQKTVLRLVLLINPKNNNNIN